MAVEPDVCTYDQDGVFVERLTDLGDGGAYSPTWNKSGSKIAFHGYDGNDTEIFKVGTSGSATPVPITSANTTEINPEWSPTGRWIVFSRQLNSGQHLFRIRPDGTSARSDKSGEPHKVLGGLPMANCSPSIVWFRKMMTTLSRRSSP